MPDTKITKFTRGIRPGNVDIVYPGHSRTLPYILNHPLDQIARAFHDCFHLTVPQVTDVSPESQLIRRVIGKISVSDPLNSAGNSEMGLDICCHN